MHLALSKKNFPTLLDIYNVTNQKSKHLYSITILLNYFKNNELKNVAVIFEVDIHNER